MKSLQPKNPQTNVPYNQVFCIKGKLSSNLCFNKNCQQVAFVCSDKTCECKQKHQLCIQISTDRIIDILNKKSISIKPFINQVEVIFNKLIDDISDMKQSILKKIQAKSTLQGLTQVQLKLVNSIRTGYTKQIKCNTIAEIFTNIHDHSQKIRINQQTNNYIKNLIQQSKEIIQKIQNSYQKYINSTNQIFTGFISNSKIVSSYQDQTNLVKFFNQKIKSASLLYTASQNQFSASKFHQNCDNIPYTLILIKTQFGKIVGGYTPLKWINSYNGHQSKDQTGDSFIFSLTNNDKFDYDKTKAAIYSLSSMGPIFGNNSQPDLYIIDKAFMNNSFSRFGRSYNNSKYKPSDQKSWQQFHGNTFNQYLKIIEWECWKLQFNK